LELRPPPADACNAWPPLARNGSVPDSSGESSVRAVTTERQQGLDPSTAVLPAGARQLQGIAFP
jgi:hypothetical protein